MTVSPFDHPILAGLLGDAEVSTAFSIEGELDALIRVETALASVEGDLGLIPAGAARHIAEVCATFVPDLDDLRAATLRDGVVVPALVQQMRQAVGDPHAAHVHFGATSQDVIDTGLVLRLQPVLDSFQARAGTLLTSLEDRDRRFGARPLMGRTRMRGALPIRVSDRVRNWTEPLARHGDRLRALRPALSVVQLAGAVGTLDALGDAGPAVRAGLAARLGLTDPLGPWHVQRASLGDFGAWLSAVTVTLGKMGADIGLMVQDEIGTARLAGGGGSSAMPHKQNPVDAEILVALARYNAAQLGGLHQALLHEQERSGAMWTLEWMILPGMVAATGAALNAAHRLTASIVDLGDGVG